jgi:hypothetical protein
MNRRSEQAAAAAEARAAGRSMPTGSSSSRTAGRTTSTSTNAYANTAAAAAAAAASNASSSSSSSLSNEQNMELIKYGVLLIVVTMALKVLVSSLRVVALALLPLLYFYAVQTCPLSSTFDAKRELKRVLRGYHLPDTHPDKPHGFLEGLAARVAAAVTTELATLPGYEVSIMNPVGNAALIVTVTVPTVNMEYYWIGALGRWYYVYSRELTPRTTTTTTAAAAR